MTREAFASAAPPTRAARWRELLLRSTEQALEDLAVADSAEVVFVHAEHAGVGAAYADAIEERAVGRGFVAAQIRIAADRSFDSLEGMVRATLQVLRVPGPGPRGPRDRGLFALLDAFALRHGARAAARFDEQAEAGFAAGDLIELARAYVVSAGPARNEKRRLVAWLDGTALAEAEEASRAVSALTARTAKRALTELTRLVRVLGHRGTLLVFRDGDSLLHLPPARRESAYTVLRELVDNADGGRGMLSTRIALLGSTALFEGARSLASLRPLAMRAQILPGQQPPPPPHRPLVNLTMPSAFEDVPVPTPMVPAKATGAPLRAVVRACQGLPPVESILSMSVGQDAIDKTIEQLFAHAAIDGSVFALLTGDYGTGKTHLLLHLAARALADNRPVFHLSLERLDTDFGNPQRHLHRILDSAILPGKARATPVDQLRGWTRSREGLARLLRTLQQVATDGEGEAARAAERALRRARDPRSCGPALDTFLGAADLIEKSNAPNYRSDAYGRLLLWLELLRRLEGCAGPVVLIDEAENLYKIGISRAERRTALRTLSFYCGGALPSACVVMAITPDVLDNLRTESEELLEEVEDQATVLSAEDAMMLRQRLMKLRPIAVPALGREHRATLLARVRATHARARGRRMEPDWGRFAEALLPEADLTPRELVRRAADWLEARWWERST
jgi:P-loop Domain of unknown function (DUF2791)